MTPIELSSDIEKDVAALRLACDGGAHLAFDMVGGAKDSNSTLAALGSLYRYGRLVLMGSTVAPVPINYMLIMINSLEIIGNFMYPHHAYLPLLALLRSGQLDTSAIIPKVFSLIDLPKAMEYAAKARSLECGRTDVDKSAYHHVSQTATGVLRAKICAGPQGHQRESAAPSRRCCREEIKGRDRSMSAAAEFQKILDHSGVVWNCWTGAMARLGVQFLPATTRLMTS